MPELVSRYVTRKNITQTELTEQTNLPFASTSTNIVTLNLPSGSVSLNSNVSPAPTQTGQTEQTNLPLASTSTNIVTLNLPSGSVSPNSNVSPAPLSEVFCFCRQGETATMVACDNQQCSYKWFHLKCLGLKKKQLPKGQWYCPECSHLTQ